MPAVIVALAMLLAADRAYAQQDPCERIRTPIDQSFSERCEHDEDDYVGLDPLGDDRGHFQEESAHGYWLPLGGWGHDWDVEIEIGGGHAVVGVVTARALVTRIGRGFVGISTGFALSRGLDVGSGITASSAELIVGATSSASRWIVWLAATYQLPAFVSGSPTDWSVAAAAVLSDRPTEGTRAMPRGDFTGLVTFGAQARTADEGWMWIGRLLMRGGYVSALSQYGSLSGYSGALALEMFLAYAPRRSVEPLGAFRIGLRGEVDLSTFWPSDVVAPLAGTLVLGWVPDPAIAIEVWGGASDFAVASRTDLPDVWVTAGARITARGSL